MVEAGGIPTVAVANNPVRMQAIKLPRAVQTRFPRGATVGTPNHADQQRNVLRDAFKMLSTATEPGETKELPYRWEDLINRG